MPVLKLTPQFHASLRRENLGPDTQRALRACIRELAGETPLPSAGDLRVKVPPVGIEEWVRTVPGTGSSLWLYYRLVGEELRLMRVSRSPPVRPLEAE